MWHHMQLPYLSQMGSRFIINLTQDEDLTCFVHLISILFTGFGHYPFHFRFLSFFLYLNWTIPNSLQESFMLFLESVVHIGLLAFGLALEDQPRFELRSTCPNLFPLISSFFFLMPFSLILESTHSKAYCKYSSWLLDQTN